MLWSLLEEDELSVHDWCAVGEFVRDKEADKL